MTAFIAGIKDRLTSEKGATATEYSLLIAFVAFAIMVGAALFGTALSDWFSDLATEVGTWSTGP
jgi:pilus assembly protein Flp/PilA